jgi:hypothetical protein
VVKVKEGLILARGKEMANAKKRTPTCAPEKSRGALDDESLPNLPAASNALSKKLAL